MANEKFMKVTFHGWKDRVPHRGVDAGSVLYQTSRKWWVRLWSLYLSVEFDNGKLTFKQEQT